MALFIPRESKSDDGAGEASINRFKCEVHEEPSVPILPPEPDQYPIDLWERGAIPLPLDEQDDGLPRWWCLHTKPRQEKATARYLRSRELAYYLPQFTLERKTPKGRYTRSYQPLFAGYVFLYGNREARADALRGNTLVGILNIVDQARLDDDLRQVRRILSSGLAVVSNPTYPTGTVVRILEGPLEGVVGVVERRIKRDRFVAVVDFLRQGAAVELRDWQVEPVEGPGPLCTQPGHHAPGGL